MKEQDIKKEGDTMIKSKTGRFPVWVLFHLQEHGNCAIGKGIAKCLGNSLLPLLQEEGVTCEYIEIDHEGEGKSEKTSGNPGQHHDHLQHTCP